MTINSDVMGASDEDLLKMPSPGDRKEAEAESQGSPGDDGGEGEPPPVEDAPRPGPGEQGAEKEEQEEEEEAGGERKEAPQKEAPQVVADQSPPAAPGVGDAGEPPSTAEEVPEKTLGTSPDYEAFYKQVMSPIKAGGKTVQLSSADEVVSLLQKGLDYTRKTMELSKHRKFVMMLEGAGLLDEGKLELAIAVYNGDREALKKLLREKKIDPVDIDTSTEDKYQAGTHAVSDKQAKLQEAIDDLKAADGGQETLSAVTAWDKESKKVLWDQPELLDAIHKQRISGVYAKISAEVERRQALGQIPSSTPFLYAYKAVGDEFQAKGVLGGATGAAPPRTPAAAGGKAPVTRRPASQPAVTAQGKSAAKAAAPTRTTPRSTQAVLNFMSLSDEEFSKIKL